MALLNGKSDGATFFRQHQTTVFLIIEVTQFIEFLHHVGDRGLLDIQGRCDVHHPSISLLLDQLVDPLQIIFGGLTGFGWHRLFRGFTIGSPQMQAIEP